MTIMKVRERSYFTVKSIFPHSPVLAQCSNGQDWNEFVATVFHCRFKTAKHWFTRLIVLFLTKKQVISVGNIFQKRMKETNCRLPNSQALYRNMKSSKSTFFQFFYGYSITKYVGHHSNCAFERKWMIKKSLQRRYLLRRDERTLTIQIA